MRVLITGGAGFIGSHIADELIAQGHECVLLDALLPEAHGSPPALDHELVVGDVTSADVLRPLLSTVDVVCHQAAMVGHGVDPFDAPSYARHNDLGTAVLLAEMYRAGVSRLVLASSMVVYGEGRYRCLSHGIVRAERDAADLARGIYEPRCFCGDFVVPELVPEDAPLEPRSTYAATKLAQEHLAGAWARQTGGSVWALRYHNVYGPRMPRDTPYAGVASIFRSALRNGDSPRVMEDGRQQRDFVHVTDVARANVLALSSPRPGFEAVNVCSGTPHTIGDLAFALADACDGPTPSIVGGARPGDVRHVVASPAKALDVLGFEAQVGFAEGVREFAFASQREPVTSS